MNAPLSPPSLNSGTCSHSFGDKIVSPNTLFLSSPSSVLLLHVGGQFTSGRVSGPKTERRRLSRT